MNPRNHPASSAHQIPSGPNVASTIQYVLRSNHPTIRALRKLVQGKLEDILDVTVEDTKMRGIIFAYQALKRLSRKDAECMRRFLWGKFVVYQEGDDAEEDDIMEYGNKKLQTLGVKIRDIHLTQWWSGSAEKTASEVIAPLVRAIIAEYGGGDEGEDFEDTAKGKKNTIVKQKKGEYRDAGSYGDAEISVDREDAMSLHLVLTMVGSYFEAMDMKVDNKIPLSRERETGRWASIQTIVRELKKLLPCIPITDAVDEYFCDFSSGLHSIIRLADTYAILHEEGEL